MKLYYIVVLAIALSACSQKSNINDYIESRPIDRTFLSLVKTIKEKSGKSVCLNPPATSQEISKAEDAVGQTFPEEIKIIYKLANGQKDGPNCAPIFLEGYSFLPLKHVIEQWSIMQQLSNGDPDFSTLYDIHGAVHGYGWMPKWIPIGYHISGDLVCLDYDPTALGRKGQIIEFIHDDTNRNHLAIDFNAYLGYIEKNLVAGKFIYRENWGVITKHKD